MVSLHRHLLRRGHDDHAGLGRVPEDVEHPAGLVPDQSDLHELVDGVGRRELPDDVAAGGGVDDDEVVVRLAHLPGQLADGEDLLHAGGGRRRRSRTCGPGDRCGRSPGSSAGGSGTPSATPRCSSTSRRGSRRSRVGSNPVRPASKKSARLPLASTSHTRVRLPCRAASVPSAAAMVVLPTPPLPVTNSSLRSSREVIEGDRGGSAPEADAASRRRGCRSPRTRSSPWVPPPDDPCGRSARRPSGRRRGRSRRRPGPGRDLRPRPSSRSISLAV